MFDLGQRGSRRGGANYANRLSLFRQLPIALKVAVTIAASQPFDSNINPWPCCDRSPPPYR